MAGDISVNKQIAKELTLAAIPHLRLANRGAENDVHNNSVADEIAKAYETIYSVVSKN